MNIISVKMCVTSLNYFIYLHHECEICFLPKSTSSYLAQKSIFPWSAWHNYEVVKNLCIRVEEKVKSPLTDSPSFLENYKLRYYGSSAWCFINKLYRWNLFWWIFVTSCYIFFPGNSCLRRHFFFTNNDCQILWNVEM